MKIPKTIKIGWRTYTIKFVEQWRDETGELLDGFIDFNDHIIYINDNLNEDEKVVTFLHEVEHGIFYSQGHLEWSENEELVTSISEGAFQLMKDNPKMFSD
jgi:Zn-dependent peptidase ImmA (M78 family)